jgi:hypothetical protein
LRNGKSKTSQPLPKRIPPAIFPNFGNTRARRVNPARIIVGRRPLTYWNVLPIYGY